MLCAVVLRRAATILLFSGSPSALLTPPSCRVPQELAAYYMDTQAAALSVHSQTELWLCSAPLSLLIGSLAVIDSSGSQ